MADLSKLVRVAMVKALKAYTPLFSMVPAARIYGPEAPGLPQWPWAYVQTPLETPDRLSCMRGARLSVTVHGFAKGPGDDDASAIGDAIKRALDGSHFSLDGATADVLHEQTQVIRDSAEASAYHAIVRFGVAVAS